MQIMSNTQVTFSQLLRAITSWKFPQILVWKVELKIKHGKEIHGERILWVIYKRCEEIADHNHHDEERQAAGEWVGFFYFFVPV